MQVNDDFYFLISGGKLVPYSPQGFFDICPTPSKGPATRPTSRSPKTRSTRRCP